MRIADLVKPVYDVDPPHDVVVFSVSETRGIVPQAELFKKQIATTDKSMYRRITFGDVVYNPYLLWNGAVGVCFYDRGGCVSPAYVVLRPRQVGTERFLHYFFRSAAFTTSVDAIATGSVTRRRTAKIADVLALDFPLPDLPHQKAANALLQTIDRKIELNRKMNATLEAMARSLFTSWFVNFDPVRDRADRSEPPYSHGAAALFPSRLVANGNREIPSGWQMLPLVSVLSTIQTGSRPKGGVATYRSGIPSVGAESIVGLGIFDYGKTKFVPASFFASMRRGICEPGDVLLYKDGGTPGRYEPHVTLVGSAFPFSQFCINEHVYRLRVDERLSQEYLYLHLSADATMQELREKGTGVAVPGLNSTALSSVPVLIPSSKTIAAFNDVVKPMFRSILLRASEARTLAIIRDALLPGLISGELGAPEVRNTLEKSA
jgi:type I restriction enzyme S subunit